MERSTTSSKIKITNPRHSVSLLTERGHDCQVEHCALPSAMMIAYEPDHVIASQNKDNCGRRREAPHKVVPLLIVGRWKGSLWGNPGEAGASSGVSVPRVRLCLVRRVEHTIFETFLYSSTSSLSLFVWCFFFMKESIEPGRDAEAASCRGQRGWQFLPL